MTVQILSRSAWGAGARKAGHLVDHDQFRGIVVHHTVMVMPDYDRDGFLHGDLDDCKRYMRQLQTARPDLGPDVPYSFVVFRGKLSTDCVLAEGRGFGVTGAHTAGYNSTRYGIAYAGNAEVDPITDGILDGYRWVGKRIRRPVATTIGHRDTKSTACPGKNLYACLGEIQPPFEEDDDMTIDELIEAFKSGPLRNELKEIVTGAGLDALREKTEARPDRGLWRAEVADIVREVNAEP